MTETRQWCSRRPHRLPLRPLRQSSAASAVKSFPSQSYREGTIDTMLKFSANLLLALALSGSSLAQDVHSLAAAVDNHYDHLRTLQADFTETYTGSGMERTESGTLWLAKGGMKK